MALDSSCEFGPYIHCSSSPVYHPATDHSQTGQKGFQLPQDQSDSASLSDMLSVPGAPECIPAIAGCQPSALDSSWQLSPEVDRASSTPVGGQLIKELISVDQLVNDINDRNNDVDTLKFSISQLKSLSARCKQHQACGSDVSTSRDVSMLM